MSHTMQMIVAGYIEETPHMSRRVLVGFAKGKGPGLVKIRQTLEVEIVGPQKDEHQCSQ